MAFQVIFMTVFRLSQFSQLQAKSLIAKPAEHQIQNLIRKTKTSNDQHEEICSCVSWLNGEIGRIAFVKENLYHKIVNITALNYHEYQLKLSSWAHLIAT